MYPCQLPDLIAENASSNTLLVNAWGKPVLADALKLTISPLNWPTRPCWHCASWTQNHFAFIELDSLDISQLVWIKLRLLVVVCLAACASAHCAATRPPQARPVVFMASGLCKGAKQLCRKPRLCICKADFRSEIMRRWGWWNDETDLALAIFALKGPVVGWEGPCRTMA